LEVEANPTADVFARLREVGGQNAELTLAFDSIGREIRVVQVIVGGVVAGAAALVLRRRFDQATSRNG